MSKHSPSDLAEKQQAFLLEEFKALRQEIDQRIRESRLVETAAVAGTAAVYAWLTTTDPTPFVRVGWWIPVLISVLGALRYFALIRRMMHIAEYLRSIECAFCSTAPRGWETFLASRRKQLSGILISASSAALWSVLFILSLILAILFST